MSSRVFALFSPFSLSLSVSCAVVCTGCTLGTPIGAPGGPPQGSTNAPNQTRCGSGLTFQGDEGPLMNPGGNCISCHASGGGGGGGGFEAESEGGPLFAFAGTVMTDLDDVDGCLGVANVRVDVIDASGSVAFSMTSNDAGNFFTQQTLSPSQLPYTVRLTRDGRTAQMIAPQHDGNCMSCHTAHGTNGAPGRIIAP